MKKFLIVLFLLVSSVVYSQQTLPPMYGWSKVYEDTLGLGYRSIWSFNYDATVDIPGAETLDGKYQDTTIFISNDITWGSATIWVKIDSVTGYTDAVLTVLASYYNNDIGLNTSIDSYGPTSSSVTAKFESVGTTSAVNAPGNQLILLSDWGSWALNQGFILKFTTTCPMKLTIWLLKQ